MPIRIMTNSLQVDIDRALVNRYHHKVFYTTVYVDLDDTLNFQRGGKYQVGCVPLPMY